MEESQKAMASIGLFPFGLGCRSAPRFYARLQALDVLSMLPADLSVLFSSSRHSFPLMDIVDK